MISSDYNQIYKPTVRQLIYLAIIKKSDNTLGPASANKMKRFALYDIANLWKQTRFKK